MADGLELLLEVGAEELPASAVARAAADLQAAVAARLEAARLPARPLVPGLGTPRRLIVAFEGLPARQPDALRRARGPALRAAYTADGAPTPALLGFCRGHGVSPEEVERDDQYVWANVREIGRDAREILADELPKAILGLSFDKSMRWGSSRMRFVRPIRWIVALLGAEIIPFSIGAVESGDESLGHRFLAPSPFRVGSLGDLLNGLRDRSVEPDPARRRAMIEAGIASLDVGAVQTPADLLEENVHLAEWPMPIAGSFPETDLELPEPVLTTAMAKHERMFPVRAEDGTLANRFVFVRNGGEADHVRRGAEWVLRARLNDARFFFEEDKSHSLREFLDKTEGILFQRDLGTVRARADRLARLAAEIAAAFGHPEESELAHQAGLLAKADLATGLVGELASLQGVIGGEYARRERRPEPVCRAIAAQYRPPEGPFDTPETRVSAYLIAADALDKLAGYLGLGLEPTGSSDPFGLRRAASALVEIAFAWPTPIPAYDELLRVALALYADRGRPLDDAGASRAFAELVAGRYAVLLAGVRHDVLEAAILREYGDAPTGPAAVRFRTRLLTRLADDAAFVQTATRPMNIVAAARRKGIAYAWEDPLRHVDPAALASPEGERLLAVLREDEDDAFRAAREADADELERLLRRLSEPINAFFDATMVMSDDPDERTARLNLCHAASLHLLRAGDWTKLVAEGRGAS